MNPDWRDDANKNIPNEKEVIINGVCVMNQSSDFKSDDGDENMEQSNDDCDDAERKLSNDEDDEIKKSFIKKPNMDKSVDGDDVQVKREVDEGGERWEY